MDELETLDYLIKRSEDRLVYLHKNINHSPNEYKIMIRAEDTFLQHLLWLDDILQDKLLSL